MIDSLGIFQFFRCPPNEQRWENEWNRGAEGDAVDPRREQPRFTSRLPTVRFVILLFNGQSTKPEPMRSQAYYRSPTTIATRSRAYDEPLTTDY
jgi:hypothetical protein